VNRVLAAMDEAGNRVNLVILDACRDNPFARSFRSAASRGLAQMEAAKGIYIVFATAPGSVASEGGWPQRSPHPVPPAEPPVEENRANNRGAGAASRHAY